MCERGRNLGIELLRIVLMFMVIFLHLTGINVESRLLCNTYYLSARGIGLYIVTALCVVAVNTFVIISGYFGVQREAKYHKAWGYWLQGFFYNVLITMVYACVSGVFPPSETGIFLCRIVGGNIWWFLSGFIFLSLFKPFLNVAINKMPLVDLKKFVVVMVLVTVVYPDLMQGMNYIFGENRPFYAIVEYGFNWIWFVCLYVIGASLKRMEKQEVKKGLYLGKYFGCIFACMGVSYGLSVWLKSNVLITYYMRYTSLFMTLGGVFLFKFFLHLEIKNKVMIKTLSISKYTFGVYLFHEHPFVRMWLEGNIYTKLPYMGGFKLILVMMVSMISIYVIGTAIDMAREKLFSWLQLEKKTALLSKRVDDKLSRYLNKETSYEK